MTSKGLLMISKFFIDRPIFATVISVVITLAGGVAVFTLPVAQYPDVTPPTVQVTASYPGANANTLRDTVAAPIEEQVSGVEGMLYMSSICTNSGSYTLTVTFQMGTDSDMAQVLVQNRVALALPVVPALVQNEGVTVKKQSPATLMIVNLIGDGDKNDPVYLSNYATIYLKDELARVEGVAGINYLGQRDYSMRAWLDPDRLAALHLNAFDVVTAIAQQNVQVAAGQVGQPPVPRGQQFQLTINTQGRLTEASDFQDIIVKVGAGAQGTTTTSSSNTTVSDLEALSTGIVRLKDVVTRYPEVPGDPRSGTPKVDLMAQQYDTSCTLDGQQSVALSVYQLPGSNALAVSQKVRATMKELSKSFPDGVHYQIVYDTTPFIRESVNEVFKTLRDAVILVAIVVLLFLQDWRAMILPMIDVPVSLIGTFAVMALLGFSLNNLTLFGLVLAIGIVVDDAIVVLENIERLIATGLDARSATIQAMEEITGPILAITLVLSAVFIPVCFLGGITGQFFRQFAVTIAVSTIISAINALTMTPSRAVVIFKSEKSEGGHHHREALPWWFFGILGGVFTIWLWPQLAFLKVLALPELPSGDEISQMPDWLYRVFPLDAATLPTQLSEDEVPSWLYWTVTAIHFLPGLLIGLAVGWYLIKPVNAVLGFVFREFNRLFDRITDLYGWVVGWFLKLSVVIIVAYGGMLFLTGWHQSPRRPPAYRSPTGQGLSHSHRATPGRRVAGAHGQGDGPARSGDPGTKRRRGPPAGSLENVGGLRPIAHHQCQRAQPGLDVRSAQELPGPSRPVRRRRERRTAGAMSKGSSGGADVRLRGTADRRPGDHGGLQTHHRKPRQSCPGGTGQGHRQHHRRSKRHETAPRPLFHIAGRYALAESRARPLQMSGPGGAGHRRVQHASGLSRFLLCEQLQPVRADLASERAGRCQLPRPGA